MIKKPLKKIFAAASGAVIAAAPASALAATGAMTALALGPVTFGAPLALLGGASLPVLWWMMRITAKKPKEVSFPPIRLLLKIPNVVMPAHMPLWHRMLRMTMLVSAFTAFAQPQWKPDPALKSAGPVMIVVDNGWSAARNWRVRMKSMNALVDLAEREKRNVIVLPTAASADGTPVHGEAMPADKARVMIRDIKPQPWLANREAALSAIREINLQEPVSAVWLSDGLDDGGAKDLANHLQKMGPLQVLEDEPEAAARLLSPPDAGGEYLSVTVRRAKGMQEDRMTLSAYDNNGNIITAAAVNLKPGETETSGEFNIPAETRNKIVRISIDGDQSAGAVLLIDERWRRRPVGLIKSDIMASSQPLLSESTYIERALDPYADMREARIDGLTEKELAVMIMPDGAMTGEATRGRIQKWVEEGGTLLRFAGPRLADEVQEKKNDTLLPADSHLVERALGGSASGGHSGMIAQFLETSPLNGIAIPDNVTIEHVMTQLGFNNEERIWAKLTDGTPLVSAEQRGKGWIVLVHTTANTDWSNMALSVFFVDIMRAVIMHSQGVTGSGDGKPLPPLKILDGHGRLIAPSSHVKPLARNAMIGPANPPGFYGNAAAQQAHNIGSEIKSLKPLHAMPEGVIRKTYRDASYGTDLSGSMLAGALTLLLADLIANMAQRGQSARRKKLDAPAPAVAS